jgi:hypothetical protein
MIRDNLGGPGSKALIVNNAVYMSLEGANMLKAIADAGIPIIFYGANTPYKVYGTEKYDGHDAAMKAIVDGIKAYDHVYTAATQQQVINILGSENVTPYVDYDFTDRSVAQVQTSTQLDEATGTYYYMLYNNNATGYVGSQQNPARPGNHTIGADGKEPVMAGSDLTLEKCHNCMFTGRSTNNNGHTSIFAAKGAKVVFD